MSTIGTMTSAMLIAGALSWPAVTSAASPRVGGQPWWLGPMELSTVEMVNVTEGDDDVGVATLIRTRKKLRMQVATTGLESDSAYSIWVAVFNEPGKCVDGCNGEDLPAADGSVFWGAAFTTGASGTANVDMEVETGGLPFGIHVFAGHDGGVRRMNGLHAEVHLVVSSHGPSADISATGDDPDWAEEMAVPGVLPGEQVALFK